MIRFLRFPYNVLLLVGLGGLVLVPAMLGYLAAGLPSPESLREVRLPVPLRVYSRDGRLVAEFGSERRDPVTLDHVPPMLVRAVLKSLALQFGVRPDVVVGFGGYTGAPGGLAARLLWKPLVIHEQNSVAGLTNRVLSHIATRTLFAFPGAFAGKVGLVGNPVRTDIAALPAPESRFAGRCGPLRLLVVGGSLGARVFNEVVPEALARLPVAERPVVVQQAGAKQLDALRDNYARAGVTADCRAFIDDMAAEYAAADLVLCRAGALTVAELAAAGVASVLVPFPHAVDDHQTGNAAFLADAGAGILLPQSGLTAECLAALLADMTRGRCLEMAVAARRLARTDAASRVADVCEELAE